jgi:hypothetical protein
MRDRMERDLPEPAGSHDGPFDYRTPVSGRPLDSLPECGGVMCARGLCTRCPVCTKARIIPHRASERLNLICDPDSFEVFPSHNRSVSLGFRDMREACQIADETGLEERDMRYAHIGGICARSRAMTPVF